MTTVSRPVTRLHNHKPATATTATTTTTGTSLKLQDLIECPRCEDIYVDPRLLPCQHSFCYSCVKQLKQPGRLIECPTCGITSSLNELRKDINKEQLVALCAKRDVIDDVIEANEPLNDEADGEVNDSELSEARDQVLSLNSFGSTKGNPAGSQPEIDDVRARR